MNVEVICKEIEDASHRPARIRRQDLRRWLLNRHPLITDSLSRLYVALHSRLTADVQDDLVQDLLIRLFNLVRQPVHEPTPFESLQYLRAIFEIQWQKHDDVTLTGIVDGLAELLGDWPNSNDLAIQVVTEHIFQQPGVVELFQKWKDNPRLKGPYDESVRLATLWQQQANG